MNKVIHDIRELVEIMSERYSENIAYEYLQDGQIVQVTYREVAQKAKAVSSFLQTNKYHRAVIGMLGSTSWSWVSAYLGVQISENVVVPIDTQLFLKDYINIVNRVKIRILFMDEKFEQYSNELKKNCPTLEKIIVFGEEFDQINDSSNDCVIPIRPNELAQYMFTSGSTGESKIVMLSYQNIITTVNSETRHFQSEDEVLLSILPVFHCYEIIIGELGILKIGGKICINDRLENILENMLKFKPTGMYTVPLIAENLLRAAKRVIRDLEMLEPDKNMTMEQRWSYYREVNEKAFGGRLHVLGCGGAKIPAELFQEFDNLGIHFMTGYGMTETAGSVTSNRLHRVKHESVGYPVNKKIEIKIDDGEVLLKGPNVMLGYYNNEEANQKIFTEDGWFRTGDIGHLDDEGFLYITGRKKNLIILDNGKNVSPEELENHLLEIPQVCNAMVYESKKKIAGVIYAKSGFDEIREKIRKLNEKLPAYKRIIEVSFLEEDFPLTSSKKVKRHEVLRILESRKQKENYLEPVSAAEIEVAQAICETLGIKEAVSMNDDYFSLGGDSYNALELSVHLRIQVQLIYDYPRLGDLAKQIEKRRKNNIESVADSDESVNQLIAFDCHKKIPEVGNNVFLTGASGFLGSHILYELLKREQLQITCLVRSKDKLERLFEYYFSEKCPDTVKVVEGDVAKEYLGLAKDEYFNLAHHTDICIHTAANVHHIGKYEEFERINVTGTRNIIKFCKEGNAILQHASTYSVSGIGVVSIEPVQEEFNESLLYIGQNYQENVYVHSKYEAEKAILEARKEGVNANIFRIGSLAWRTTDRVFQNNSDDNGLVNKLYGQNEIGCYTSKMAEYWVDFTQVDDCARAFVLLALQNEVNNIYHLFNHKVKKIYEFESMFEKNYEEVSEEVFYEKIKDRMDNKYIANYAFYHALALKSKSVPIHNNYTVNCLSKLGFVWTEPDKDYIMEGLTKLL